MIKDLINYFTKPGLIGEPTRTIRGGRVAAWLYVFMGMATFAHIWTNYPIVHDSYQCRKDHDVITVENCGRDLFGSSIAAGVAGVAWPLVVSVEAYQAATE